MSIFFLHFSTIVFFLKKIFVFILVHWYFTCMNVCVRMSDLLELELQTAVNCHVGAHVSRQDSFHQQLPHVISEVLSKDGL